MENQKSKKVLVIINPCSGRYTLKKQLWHIADMFTKAGFETTVYTTQKRGDATEYAKLLADKFDLIVCRGGDGTFNETVNGVIQSGIEIPIGYIPSGTTNDFAASIGVPTDAQKAIDLICEVEPKFHDMGQMNNERYFCYTASFGIFTKSSYSVSQSAKNIFGYPAYFVAGLKELKGFKPLAMKIECDNTLYEGEYAFGAISSSLSIGNIIKYKREDIDFDDGLFELNLAKLPHGAKMWTEKAKEILLQHTYADDMFTLTKGSHFVVECLDGELPWTLDGEYGGAYKIAEFDCRKHAVKVYRS
ncbi:MAG: diacylglycerol kinase family lipid kinase [Clostridia bacterium]|nr:diacylglycerol kinase family lipid kinase [Clostridia bacterium]